MKVVKVSKNYFDNLVVLEVLIMVRELVVKVDVRFNLVEVVWNEERNKNEFSKVRVFRKLLMKFLVVL